MVNSQENEKKRLIHFASGDIWAGAEAQVFQTVKGLQASGKYHVSCVLMNGGLLLEKLVHAGIPTLVIDENRFSSWEIMQQLTDHFGDNLPDIVHVHAVKEHFLAKLAAVKVKKKVQNLIRIVRTVHGARKVPDGIPFKNKLKSSVIVSLDTFLIKYLCDVTIAVSRELESEISGYRPRGKVQHIYNSIEPAPDMTRNEKGQIKAEHGFDGKFWIGTAARLVEPKNLFMLIRCAQLLKKSKAPFVVTIHGEGPLRKVLSDEIQTRGLENSVTLKGFESHMEKTMAGFDLFVMTSFNEGLPMALLEAMNLNVPVLCTNVGGMKEMISDKVNGLLVESDDHSAMADEIIGLLDDRMRLDQLAVQAKTMLNSKFSIYRNTQILEKLYDSFE